MGIKTFLLPDLGEGLTEAELVRWMVAAGDTVAVDQPIAEVETAKSLVEIPCPFEGVVHQLHGDAGQMMLVDEPFISVATANGEEPGGTEQPAVEGAQSYREEEQAGTKAPAAEAEADADEGSGNVLIGYGTPASGSGGSRRRRSRAPKPGNAAPAAQAAAPLVINPIVRKLARDHGIDIATVNGSGEGGMVLRSDIDALISGATAPAGAQAATAAPAASPAPASHAAPPAAGQVDARTGLPVAEATVLTGVRRTIANAMSTSRREIPEATVWVDVDVTKLLKLRAKLKESTGSAPSMLALIARFAVLGLRKFPELNSRIEVGADGQLTQTRFDGVNLGFAAQTERGLVVPNVRGAHALDATELSAEFARLASLAREGKAQVADLSGSTFTINNYGVFNVDGSAAIINYPEAAILGIGRVVERPWAVKGKVKVRSICELTLSFDHRVCDGGTAAGFLRFVADAMTDPKSIIVSL